MNNSPPAYAFPVLLVDPAAKSRLRRILRSIHRRGPTQAIKDLTLILFIAVTILALLRSFAWFGGFFR